VDDDRLKHEIQWIGWEIFKSSTSTGVPRQVILLLCTRDLATYAMLLER
jgi:hypothetical protein